MARPRLAAGSLLAIVLIAVMVLAMMALFQSFAEQVTRGQKTLREASYLRYLGDSALTEATLFVTDSLNNAVAGGAGGGGGAGADLRAAIPGVIPVPKTQELAGLVLPRAATIEVAAVWDRDQAAAQQQGSWGDTPEMRNVSKIAFPGEEAGLLTLVATVTASEPNQPELAAKMSRAFAYRIVSPLPPKGLDEVTFLAHKWDYFRDRLGGAMNELISMIIQAEAMREFGKLQAGERAAALSDTAAYSRTIGKLSAALMESFGENNPPQDGPGMHRLLSAKINEKCGGEGCQVPGSSQRWDGDRFAGCMIASDTFNDGWRNGVVSPLLDPAGYLMRSTIAHYEDALVRHRAGQLEVPPEEPPRDRAHYEREVQQHPDLVVGISNDLLKRGGGKELQSSDVQGALRELEQRWNKVSENPGGESEGMRLPGCHTPEYARDKNAIFELMYKRATAVGGGEGNTQFWKRFIGQTLTSSLKTQLQQMQSNQNAAGAQMSLENIFLWSSTPETLHEDERKKVAEKLDQLKITKDNTGNLSDLQYQGLAPIQEVIDAASQRAAAIGQAASPQGGNLVAGGQVDAGRQMTEQLMNTAPEKLLAGYLNVKPSREVLSGPVYLTDPVAADRLAYVFSPAPFHTNMVELFPLPVVPYRKQGGLDDNYRGFLVAHANFGRKLGDHTQPYQRPPAQPGGGNPPIDCDSDGEEWKPPYKAPGGAGGTGGGSAGTGGSQGGGVELIRALQNTKCLAWDMASVHGLPAKFKSENEFGPEVMKLLEGQHPDFRLQEPVLDPKRMEERSGYDSQLADNPMVANSTAKEAEAVEQYVTKWNEMVDKFLVTLEDTHKKHNGQPFKAWPNTPPPALQGNAIAGEGWEQQAPPDSVDYTDETALDALVGAPGFRSKGESYIEAVLDPTVNRQRSAFRFENLQEFYRFLVAGCGTIQGTYYIESQGDAEIKASEVVAEMQKFGCAGVNPGATGSTLALRGFGYLSFPGKLVIEGSIRADAKDGTPNGGKLVVLAKGITFKGSSPEFHGMALSNGEFNVELPGNDVVSVTGTVVTTGTPTEGDQAIVSPGDLEVGSSEADEFLQKSFGALKQIKIDPDPNRIPREQGLRIVFSPFRVSQDFQVIRR